MSNINDLKFKIDDGVITLTKEVREEKKPEIILDALSELLIRKRKEAGLSVKDIAKKFGFRHITGIMQAISATEENQYDLCNEYAHKLFDILGMDKNEYNKLLNERIKTKSEERERQIRKIFGEIMLIYKNSELILSTPEYYFVRDEDIFISVAYLQPQPMTLGILLTHWKENRFCDDTLCCGRVLKVTAGGSPLSGSNGWSGFCSKCGKFFRNGGLDSWGHDLHVHLRFKPPFDKPEKVPSYGELINYLKEAGDDK